MPGLGLPWDCWIAGLPDCWIASRNISDCSHFLILVSIRTALLSNIKFGEGCEGRLFFAMSIVKIRLQKVRLNFHRRNGPRCFEFRVSRDCWIGNNTWTHGHSIAYFRL